VGNYSSVKEAQVSIAMFPIAIRSTSQTASRSLARGMSSAPKLHKAADEWGAFIKQRPPLDVSLLLPLLFPRPNFTVFVSSLRCPSACPHVHVTFCVNGF
jgi:hypothetical protein